ncbi:MAG: methylthioribulose 1-phosphate dehydratase [Gemmatimonadota bacterium]
MQFPDAARDLAELGRRFHGRGWALGTSGNFSVVVSRDPLRLAISASSIAKGTMRDADVLEVDDRGVPSGPGAGAPSAETLLHVEIARRCSAGAVLHTHSVWATILSGLAAHSEGIAIEGFEMLKGLAGVRTHEHREWIPVVDNDQDMTRLAPVVGAVLERNPGVHAFLLRRHGMYTWGATLAEAERHVEILEFLLEATGRSMMLGSRDHGGG